MFNSFKVLKGVGILGGILAAGAAAGAAVLVKKWKDDPDSGDLRVVLMNGKGLKLSKSPEGRIILDTHYDVNGDEAVLGTEPAVVVDLQEKVKELGREAGADVKAAAEIAADKAGTAAEQLWEKTEGLREAAEEKAGETKEQLREKAAAIAAQMKERAGEVCDGFQKMTQFAREQAENLFAGAQETAEKTEECCEACAGKAEEAMEAAREACQEFAETGEKELENLAAGEKPEE